VHIKQPCSHRASIRREPDLVIPLTAAQASSVTTSCTTSGCADLDGTVGVTDRSGSRRM